MKRVIYVIEVKVKRGKSWVPWYAHCSRKDAVGEQALFEGANREGYETRLVKYVPQDV